MNDDELLTRLVKMALVFKYDQELYNKFYEICKENFADNIFNFAKEWSIKKRELVEKGENRWD